MQTSMASKRQLQVGEQVKRHFSAVLQEEGTYVFGAQPLVTVTEVHMSPDLSLAKIYLSVFNTEDKQTVILEMEEHYPRLRQGLGNRLSRHVRRIPELNFYLDDTLDEMYRLREVFDRMNNPQGLEDME
jgi:ribosome-binding factor A